MVLLNCKLKKSAAIIVSFSWIFMIIIGSFFIFFAYNVISTYQENEERKNDLQFSLALQTIFTKIGYGGGLESTSLEKIEYIFEDSELTLECVAGSPLLGINENFDPNNDYLRNYPFFMTKVTQDKVDETYVAVEKFDMPFAITPMMALVSKRNLYVFDQHIWDSVFEDKFTRSSAFKELTIEVAQFNDTNSIDQLIRKYRTSSLDSITFIRDDTPGLIPNFDLSSTFPTTDVINLKIETNTLEFNFNSDSLEVVNGSITYLNTSYWTSNLSSEYTFEFVDLKKSYTLPTMALFSSPEAYSCGMKTLDSLIDVSYQYFEEKTDIVLREIDQNFIVEKYCSSSLDTSIQVEALYTSMKDGLQEIKNSDKFKNADDLILNIVDLWKSQQVLEQYNCEYIY